MSYTGPFWFPCKDCGAEGCAACDWTGSHPKAETPQDIAASKRAWMELHNKAARNTPGGHAIPPHPWS